MNPYNDVHSFSYYDNDHHDYELRKSYSQSHNCTENDDDSLFPRFHESLTCEEIDFQRKFIANNLETTKHTAILYGTFGIISTICSSFIIWMIVRSNDRFSTPYHRLLLGMCISDILYSLGLAHFNLTTPKHDCWIWNASGTRHILLKSDDLHSFGIQQHFPFRCSCYLYISLRKCMRTRMGISSYSKKCCVGQTFFFRCFSYD